MKRVICALCSLILAFSGSIVPSYSAELPAEEFHTEEQYEYIIRSKDDLNAVFDYADGSKEKSIPDPIVCEFWDDGIAESEWYVFQKSPTPDFSDCETITGLALKEYEYYNAYLGEHFYWRGGSDLETIENSPVHETTVSSLAPRVCYVPGVTNVRDIGGYESSLVPGGRIRQGLYYRGAYINDMTREGLEILYGQLGVRAEIDLRDADRGRNYIKGIEKIAYINAPMSYEDYYGGHADAYKIVFDTISNAAEAPVYLHCQAGADRTGISSFMLLTVCGVSFEDAALDYMFTNFSVMGSRVLGTPENYYERLNEFGEGSKAEQAKRWIMSKGVSEETVELIRETFVEGYESEYLKTLIREVHIDDETLSYKVGDAPTFTGIVPNGAAYTLGEGVSGIIGSIEWRGNDESAFTSDREKNAALLSEGKLIDTFKSGVNYSLCVSLAASTSTPFAERTALFLNGEKTDAKALLSQDGAFAVFEKVFRFTPEAMTGDIDGDGSLSARDVIALMKMVLSPPAQIDSVADVVQDDSLNARDVIALMKLVLSQIK